MQSVDLQRYKAKEVKRWAKQRHAKLRAIEALLWTSEIRAKRFGKLRKAIKKHLAFQVSTFSPHIFPKSFFESCKASPGLHQSVCPAPCFSTEQELGLLVA